jgi:hypothetical protein
MSLLAGPVDMKAKGDHFFHCDKEKGGCGHISRYAKTKLEHTSARPVLGWDGLGIEWVATYCYGCGKPVELT